MLYLAFQAAAVALIYAFVRTVEGGTLPAPLDRLGTIEGTSGELVIMTVAVVGSFLAGHLAIYRARILAVDAAVALEERCGRRVVAAYSRLPDLMRPAANKDLAEIGIRQLAFTDPRYCGLIIRLIVLGIPLAVALMGALVALTAIDPELTAVIVLAGVVLFLPQYPANVQAAKATRRWQSLRAPALRRLLDTIADLRGDGTVLAPDARLLNRLFDDKAVAGMRHAYGDRLKALEVGTLVTQVGMIVLTGAVVFWIGSQAVSGSVDWALLVSYVTVLRVATSSLVGLARTTTGIARLYPQAQELTRFLQEVESPAAGGPVVAGGWALRVAFGRGSRAAAEHYRAGDRIAVIPAFPGVDDPIAALGAAAILEPTAAGDHAASETTSSTSVSGAVARVGFGPLSDDAPMGAALNLPDDVDATALGDALKGLGADTVFAETTRHLVDGLALSRRPDPGASHDLNPTATALLEMAAARLRGAVLIVLDSEAIAPIARQAPEVLDRLGAGNVLAITYRAIDTLPDHGEAVAFVCRNGALVSCVPLGAAGDLDPWPGVQSAVRKARRIKGVAGGQPDDIDLED